MINLHSSVLKRQIDLNSEASMGDFYNIVSQFKIEGKIKRYPSHREWIDK